jgi:hypothetical protein
MMEYPLAAGIVGVQKDHRHKHFFLEQSAVAFADLPDDDHAVDFVVRQHTRKRGGLLRFFRKEFENSVIIAGGEAPDDFFIHLPVKGIRVVVQKTCGNQNADVAGVAGASLVGRGRRLISHLLGRFLDLRAQIVADTVLVGQRFRNGNGADADFSGDVHHPYNFWHERLSPLKSR